MKQSKVLQQGIFDTPQLSDREKELLERSNFSKVALLTEKGLDIISVKDILIASSTATLTITNMSGSLKYSNIPYLMEQWKKTCYWKEDNKKAFVEITKNNSMFIWYEENERVQCSRLDDILPYFSSDNLLKLKGIQILLPPVIEEPLDEIPF